MEITTEDIVEATLYYMDEEPLNEILKAEDPVEVWIHDFIKSDNPRFKGKDKKTRIRMALGAWYAARKKAGIATK